MQKAIHTYCGSYLFLIIITTIWSSWKYLFLVMFYTIYLHIIFIWPILCYTKEHVPFIWKKSISCYVFFYFLWNHLSVLLSCTVFIFHSMRTCHAWNLGPNFKVKVAVTIWTLSVLLCKPYFVSSFTNYKWSKLNLLYMLPMNCKCERHILLKPD